MKRLVDGTVMSAVVYCNKETELNLKRSRHYFVKLTVFVFHPNCTVTKR